MQRTDSFEKTLMLGKIGGMTTEAEIQPVHPKGNPSWIFIGRTDAEAETPTLGHLMWRVDSFEKTLLLGKIEGRRKKGWQRMRWLDGITWVWVDSGSWWWTGRPGVLQFMGSQRVGHYWETELNWIFHCVYVPQLLYPFICRWASQLLPSSGYYK